MNTKKSWLYAALFSFLGIGAVVFLFRTPFKKWTPSRKSDVSISIENPQETLLHLDITNEKSILHSDWYDLCTPMQFALINGLIRSVRTRLLLDVKEPIHLSVTSLSSNNISMSPKITMSISSAEGFVGAKNLFQLISIYLSVEKKDTHWSTDVSIPNLPTINISWVGTNKNILIIGSIDKQSDFDYSLFEEQKSIEQGTILEFHNKQYLHTLSSLEYFKVSLKTQPKKIIVKGTGIWKGDRIATYQAPQKMIAGINIEGIPKIQIYKQNNSLCFAGDIPKLQKSLDISLRCPLLPTQGIFVLIKKELFEHLHIPISEIKLMFNQEENYTISALGTIQKEREDGLIPLYKWIFNFLLK